MSELNKKYLEQSGVQEIVKKVANIAAHLSSTDAQLTEFIEKIGNILYGEGSGFPYDDVTDYQAAEPIAKKLSELLALVGKWTENEEYLPDTDMNNTVIDVLKRVRDLVGTYEKAGIEDAEEFTVIGYFKKAIDDEIVARTKADEEIKAMLYNAEAEEEAFGGDNKTVRGELNSINDKFTKLLANEEEGETQFSEESGKTVRGEINKTRDYIAEKAFVGAEGLYKDGWLDIAFKNAKGEVIGADQLTAGKALEGEVTMQFDFTRLTRDAFLKSAKQVEVISVADYINLANNTQEAEGLKYTNLQAGKEIASKADGAVKIAYDVTDYKVFGIDNESVATEYGVEYKKLGETKLNHLYLVFVFELKSDDVDEQLTAMDTVWVDVANLIKHYAFAADGSDKWEDLFDSDEMKDYQFDKFFEFTVVEADREDDAQKKLITYKFNTTREFSEYMKQIDDNKAEIEKVKEFVGYSEEAKDGPTLQDQIDAEKDRAEKAEQEINDKIGNSGKDAEGNTQYDSFNEDIAAETIVDAINEVDDKVNDLDDKVGNLEDLNEGLEADSVVEAVNNLDEKLNKSIGDLSNWEDHEGNKHETVLDAVKALDECVDDLEGWIDDNAIEIGDSNSVAGDGTLTGMFKEAFGEDYSTYFE